MTPPGSAAEGASRRAALAALGALALAGCAGAEEEDGMRQDRIEAGGRTVAVEGAALHFIRDGAGGAPVVLIHGASGNLRDWTLGPFEAVATRRETLAFDRPGLGLSPWPGPEAIALSDQARRMRLALAAMGIDRVVLVGHSYGGSVALAWALDAPGSVAGLLLLAAPSQVWEGGLGLSTDLLASPVTGPILASAIPSLLPRSAADAAVARVFAPQPPVPGYLDHMGRDLVLRPAALRANARQLAALKSEISAMVPRYPGLRLPVEILHGDADETVPIAIHSEPLARQIPGARLTVLPGVGHMPQHVALPETLAALDRLLAAA